MKFLNPYFTEKEKIELLERWLIVHSIIYYRLGDSIVTDQQFDKNAYQLLGLKNKKSFLASKYFHIFKNFDGSTGFDLFKKLDKKQQEKFTIIAERLLKERR